MMAKAKMTAVPHVTATSSVFRMTQVGYDR